jgi:hypothetical protein
MFWFTMIFSCNPFRERGGCEPQIHIPRPGPLRSTRPYYPIRGHTLAAMRRTVLGRFSGFVSDWRSAQWWETKPRRAIRLFPVIRDVLFLTLLPWGS